MIFVCHVSLAVSKCVFVYHISSTLDDSRLGYGGISIFKMLTSAILDFHKEAFDYLTCFMRVILPPHTKFHLNGTTCS